MKVLSRNEMLRLASPFPYVLATVIDREGRPNAIGLGWWTFTSWQPPELAISVGHPRYSHECLEHCREYVLHFPSAEQAKGAWLCGSVSGRQGDKLADAGFQLIPSLEVRPPTIDGVTVALECKVNQSVESGDHTVYIGKVVAMRGDPGKASHLYSIHYDQLVALGSGAQAEWEIAFK